MRLSKPTESTSAKAEQQTSNPPRQFLHVCSCQELEKRPVNHVHPVLLEGFCRSRLGNRWNQWIRLLRWGQRCSLLLVGYNFGGWIRRCSTQLWISLISQGYVLFSSVTANCLWNGTNEVLVSKNRNYPLGHPTNAREIKCKSQNLVLFGDCRVRRGTLNWDTAPARLKESHLPEGDG